MREGPEADLEDSEGVRSAPKPRAETEGRFQTMADDAPAIIWVTDPSGRCIWLNRGWYVYTGMTREQSEGFGWLDAVHPDDREEAERIFVDANAGEEPFTLEYRVCRHDGTYRWAVDTGNPRWNADGSYAGYVGTVIDIDDRRQAELKRDDLVREMTHRLKNAFAITQSVVTQSLRRARTIEEARNTIPGRLTAMASSQDLLSQTEQPSAQIKEIVEAAIRPFRTGQGRFVTEGLEADISGEQSLGLSLAIHELATNAAKYGALSVPSGRIRIAWNVGPDGAFEFKWEESGGPLVQPPSDRGFGSRLIERSVALYFNGQAELAFDPSGVRFVLQGLLEAE